MNAADHIYTLRRTPFALAPVIHSFYDHWDPIEGDILLSYLVLPLVTYKPAQAFLTNASKRSSLRTLLEKPSRVLGLEARIEEYKPITNASLLILTSEKSIKINENMSVKPQGKIREENADTSFIKCARKFAVVLAGESVVSVYRSLGLKSL